MAHFAQIDENNFVVNVLVIPDEQENRGQEYLATDLNLGGTWIQTSYNHRIRKQYAIVGGKYDATNDVFLMPQPYPSWTLDSNFDWQPPVAYPSGDAMYAWDEDKRQWNTE